MTDKQEKREHEKNCKRRGRATVVLLSSMFANGARRARPAAARSINRR